MKLINSLSLLSFVVVTLAMPSADRVTEAAEAAKLLNAGPENTQKFVDLVTSIEEKGDPEERGIIGLVLDLLTGSPPEASPTPGGLVVHTGPSGQFHPAYPGTGYGGGFPYGGGYSYY